MKDWQVVYKNNLLHRAEMVKSILEDQNLNPVILNKKDSAYQLGYCEVLVAPEHVIRAMKVINEEIRFE